jgi:hypothetical protein
VDISDDRGRGLDRKWPLRINIWLHNASGSPLPIGPVDWVAGSDQAQLDVDPEDGTGWEIRISNTYSKSGWVAADEMFAIWWGINTNYSREHLQALINSRRLGTLIVYVAVGTESRQVSIAI